MALPDHSSKSQRHLCPPLTMSEALEVRPRTEKTTSPASLGVASLTTRVYLRPWQAAWKRPELPTVFPPIVHLARSLGLSWDRMHSKLQLSPASTSVVFSLLVMPTRRSEGHREYLGHICCTPQHPQYTCCLGQGHRGPGKARPPTALKPPSRRQHCTGRGPTGLELATTWYPDGLSCKLHTEWLKPQGPPTMVTASETSGWVSQTAT